MVLSRILIYMSQSPNMGKVQRQNRLNLPALYQNPRILSIHSAFFLTNVKKHLSRFAPSKASRLSRRDRLPGPACCGV